MKALLVLVSLAGVVPLAEQSGRESIAKAWARGKLIVPYSGPTTWSMS